MRQTKRRDFFNPLGPTGYFRGGSSYKGCRDAGMSRKPQLAALLGTRDFQSAPSLTFSLTLGYNTRAFISEMYSVQP